MIPKARSQVINDLQNAVLVLDNANRLIDHNPAFGKMFQWKDKELMGKPIQKIIESKELLDFLSEGAEAGHGRVKLFQLFGAQFYEVSLSALISKNKNVTGTIALFRDATDRIKIEERLKQRSEELRHTNQLQNRLFSIIAHDLRSPMSNLQAVLKMVKGNDLKPEDQQSILSDLSANVDSSVALMENLFQWAQAQLKGDAFNPTSLDCIQLAEEVIKQLEPGASRKKIKLRLEEVNEKVSKAFADREMMRIVLRNLISNAIKF
jgi:PAS domain S-box-containing protein